MKQALISPAEVVFDYSNPPMPIGARVAEVMDAAFEVAAPLFWVPCADDVTAHGWYWTGSDLVMKPPAPIMPVMPHAAQTTGAGGPNIVA